MNISNILKFFSVKTMFDGIYVSGPVCSNKPLLVVTYPPLILSGVFTYLNYFN